MTRFNRAAIVVIAAAAIAPAAYAADTPDPNLVDIPGLVLTAPPAPFPLPDPAYAVDIPTITRQPSAAKQKGFWGMTATTRRGVQLITDNSPSQNRITLRNLRIASHR